ncbi:MAG: hypothetical protein HC939_11050 [Pleurocapsa sp. SU_5_0]|nr:hypothetical protein [Pleurocapsa sp. SU_5_0]NJO96429.1 hypothetical protein [Pleurocapsa sp. CRU_1_2]NJR45532.1 hypothetical protein [Hyellaceae cyanobacterium CSU_1_1]
MSRSLYRAFVGNTIASTRPQTRIDDQDYVKTVSLAFWCKRNFISRDTGYKLIKLKYLIAYRRHGYYWVCANPLCLPQLLEFLGVDSLLFDVEQ